MNNFKLDKIIENININPYDADNLNRKELETIVELAADKFFNTDTPIMEDNVYDILIDFLRTKYPKSKVLKIIGAKIKLKNKVKLDYWLGSMDKIKPGSKDLDKWLNTYHGRYLLSDKLDGISALLIYYNNGNINMYTRGTSSEGVDITPLLKYFNIPSIEKIKAMEFKSVKKNILVAFRGELILKKQIFNSNWSNIMKNARNTVAGLVNSKNINPKLAIDTSFVVYELVDPLFLPEEQLNISKKLGFDTVHYKMVSKINYELLSEYLKKRRDDSNFTIDGIIVTNNKINERNIKSNPEYAFAFKDILEDQMAETVVLDIEWNISKDGLIKPVLIIEPVQIGGVEINRVTAHNAKNVVDKKLGKGAVIQLIRSGDVIPYVQNVIKPADIIQLPTGEWSWNKSGVDIVSNNLASKEILIKNIYYFFSSLDTKGLGEKIVEKLIEAKLDTVKKIIQTDNFENVDGIKKKGSSNLIISIKKALTDIKLSKFMAASNKLGSSIGEERTKQVLEKYPDLLIDYKKWSKQEFIDKLKILNGWDDKISMMFVSNFDEFIKFYNNLKDLISFQEIQTKKIIKNKYLNLTIVISGFRDSVLQQFLENSGAKLTSTVSKNTDLVIVKDQNTINEETGKVKKALELGITIITKDKIKF
jgi:NAD-dependent DNA ligase